MSDEAQIQAEVQRRVAAVTVSKNEEIAELRNIINDCKDKLVQQQAILVQLTSEPVVFSTLLDVKEFPDPSCFRTHDEVVVVIDRPGAKSGKIISGLNGEPVIDENGRVRVKLNDETQDVFGIGLPALAPVEVRLSKKPDGTFAVLSVDGKAWEVKGVPNLDLRVGETVKIRPDNKAIMAKAKVRYNAGPICRVIAITEKGVEVLAKGEVVQVFNPHRIELEEGDRVLCDAAMYCVLEKLPQDSRERYKVSSDLNVSWDDIGGLNSAKQELRDALELPYQEPTLFSHYNVQPLCGFLIYGPPGCGKAQPLTSLVMTPQGPIQMGDVTVGRLVCTPDGGTAPVTGIFPQGKKDIYRIFFSDESFADCCEDHLWKVEAKSGYRKGVFDTKTLMGMLDKRTSKHLYWIEMTKPVFFDEKPHLIHPYVMGILIAEGHFGSSVSVTICEPEIFDRVSLLLPAGYSLKSKNDPDRPCDYYITRDDLAIDSVLTSEILRLGLKGCRSHEKFIPSEYLNDLDYNRLALLQGLMDGDGTVSKHGYSVSYTTVSEQLFYDVQFLVQSLGGECPVSIVEKTYTYKGVKRKGRLAFMARINMLNMKSIFTLKRKVDRVIERTKCLPKRHIDRIEYIGHEEAQCIMIDHPDHLYLTDNFVVTHNTLLARAAAVAVAKQHGKSATESGYIYVKSPEILDKWVGNSEAEIRSLFERGRRHFRQHGYKAMLVFDEADAIMPQRGSRHSSDIADTLVPMFLGEMQGLDTDQTAANPIVVLLTNRADILDPAIIRPGRISKHIKVDRPTDETALDIFDIHTKKLPFAEIDKKPTTLALATSDLFSQSRVLYTVNSKNFCLGDAVNGAMIEAVVESAKMLALHRDIKNKTCTGVTVDDFRKAISKLYEAQRGLNHTYDLQDFAEKNQMQPNNLDIKRSFGSA